MMNGGVGMGHVSLYGDTPFPNQSDRAYNIEGHYPNHAYDSEDFELEEEATWQGGEEELVMETILVIGPEDQRFGFSVMGGVEEGFLPSVDAILPGSPADRADLEIGDEILEVNGRSLENATHEEVISHIHQCVKSRTINLRVKRRTVRDGGLDDIEKKRLQQAYVIAVEQQARDKISKITTQNNIQTIDLTSIQNNNQNVGIPNGHTYVELHPHTNGYPEPQISASSQQSAFSPPRQGSGLTISSPLQEPPLKAPGQKPLLTTSVSGEEPVLTATSAHVPEDGFGRDRLSQLFGEDFQLPDEPQGGYDNPTFELEFPSASDTSPPETRSVTDSLSTSQSVQEPVVQPQIITKEEAPPVDLRKLDASLNNLSPSRAQGRSRNTMPEPSAEVKVDTRPREVAVDCPPGFVAASGMKDPPIQSVNNSTKVINNGHTMTNGTDSITINSRQNHNTNFDTRNIKGSHKHPAVSHQQNASQNNSQGVIAFEPVSNRPLFDEPDGPKQYSAAPSQPAPQRKVLGLQDLLSTLSLAQAKVGGSVGREDVNFLQQFFHNSEVQHAVSIQHTVGQLETSRSPPLPVSATSETLAAEIAYSSRGKAGEVDELRRLLSKPALRGLFRAHDNVASPDPANLPADVYPEVDLPPEEGGDSVKIVRIEKTGEPLGATILNEDDMVIIGRIIRGGMAEKSGLLHEGDEILQINGEEVAGKSVNEISDIMAGQTGTMTFLIAPSQTSQKPPPPPNTVLLHARALFDYDPEDDMYIPCRELGLSFRKGDILHIIENDDVNWWQAFREGDEDQSLAGLVPSQVFQQQREAMKQPANDDDQENEKGSLLCSCRGKKNKKKKKRRKKKPYNPDADDDENEILTYEEVGLYTPDPNYKRPIVLIGPPHVGRQELKQRLLESDRRFKAPVPHTTRVMKEHEINSVDYHFTNKTRFEQDIMADKFVEYGDYEGNLYGTSIDSIRAVINESKICLLNLHAQALKKLKRSTLKPYFIFICPPSIDRLRQQRTEAGELLKEQELREIIDTGRGMEDAFGHFFDHVIIHHDHDRAYNELILEIDRIQVDPQWVPIEWLS